MRSILSTRIMIMHIFQTGFLIIGNRNPLKM